jgi:hypothetical protein
MVPRSAAEFHLGCGIPVVIFTVLRTCGDSVGLCSRQRHRCAAAASGVLDLIARFARSPPQVFWCGSPGPRA